MATHTLIIQHDDDLSPAEFAQVVSEALRTAGVNFTSPVKYTDLDTILWVAKHEEIEGIDVANKGSGFAAPRHLAILSRAGY